MGGWTCRKCKTRYETRNKLRCVCGRQQPKKYEPAHRQVLKELSYADFVAVNGGDFCWIGRRLGRDCGKDRDPKAKRLHRDHSHDGQGKARGLLCFRCNKLLVGGLTLELVEAIIEYLERTEPKQRCSMCEREKPVTEFSRKGKTKSGEDRYYPYCKECARDYQRPRILKWKYGIEEEEYLAILEFQGGVCALCKRPPKEDGNRLAVDHDHETGLIRGALCWTCNKFLGYVENNPGLMALIPDYLEHPPAVEALGKEIIARNHKRNQ